MTDGKICKAVSLPCMWCCDKTDESYRWICYKTSRHNNLQMRVLHFTRWLSFFERLLQITYRLGIKKRQARGDNKLKLQNKKQTIQELFKTNIRFQIDEVTRGRTESQKTDTQLEWFLKNYRKSAKTRFELNTKELNKYEKDTAKVVVKQHSWFYMPTSVHKIQ